MHQGGYSSAVSVWEAINMATWFQKLYTAYLETLHSHSLTPSRTVHASHSSSVMKRTVRSSGHKFSGEMAGHSSKLQMPPISWWRLTWWPINSHGSSHANLARLARQHGTSVYQLGAASTIQQAKHVHCFTAAFHEDVLSSLSRQDTWTPIKATCLFPKNSWSDQVKRSPKEHVMAYTNPIRDLDLKKFADWPRMKSPPFVRLKWCLMLWL